MVAILYMPHTKQQTHRPMRPALFCDASKALVRSCGALALHGPRSHGMSLHRDCTHDNRSRTSTLAFLPGRGTGRQACAAPLLQRAPPRRKCCQLPCQGSPPCLHTQTTQVNIYAWERLPHRPVPPHHPRASIASCEIGHALAPDAVVAHHNGLPWLQHVGDGRLHPCKQSLSVASGPHQLLATWYRAQLLTCMPSAADQQHVLGLRLEKVPQTVLDLIHDGQEGWVEVTCKQGQHWLSQQRVFSLVNKQAAAASLSDHITEKRQRLCCENSRMSVSRSWPAVQSACCS